MRITRSVLLIFVLIVLTIPSRARAQAAPTAKFTLDKAAVAMEITNDQREPLVPAPGQTFLWITATESGVPQTVDLTKVAVTSSGASFPLIGVDSAWGGDPKQFSMIAPARTKEGKMYAPLEETRSVGTIAFAFTPGKTAELKVISPPQS